MDSKKTGAFIHRLRKENGMTQKELAEKLRCSDKAVSRWETGKGFPDVSFLIPIGNLFGVSVNELLTGELIEKKEAVKKSDELLVDTMRKSERRISKFTGVLMLLLCIIQLLLFYVIPAFAQNGDEMGSLFFIILATLCNSIGTGTVKSNLKYAFPLFCTLAFIPTIFLIYNSTATIYIGVYFAISSVGILLGGIIRKVASLIREHIIDR